MREVKLRGKVAKKFVVGDRVGYGLKFLRNIYAEKDGELRACRGIVTEIKAEYDNYLYVKVLWDDGHLAGSTTNNLRRIK